MFVEYSRTQVQVFHRDPLPWLRQAYSFDPSHLYRQDRIAVEMTRERTKTINQKMFDKDHPIRDYYGKPHYTRDCYWMLNYRSNWGCKGKGNNFTPTYLRQMNTNFNIKNVSNIGIFLLWCPVVYDIWTMVYSPLGIKRIMARSLREEIWASEELCKKKKNCKVYSFNNFLGDLERKK